MEKFSYTKNTIIYLTIAIVFVGLIAWQISTFFITKELNIQSPPNTRIDQRIEKITSSDIFGYLSEEPPTSANQSSSTIRQSSLSYNVKGIIISENPDYSSAIIETEPNVSKHIRSGSEINPNIKLITVNKYNIVVDNHGIKETLPLKKLIESSITNGNVDNQANGAINQLPSQINNNEIDERQLDNIEDGPTKELIQQRLQELKDRNP